MLNSKILTSFLDENRHFLAWLLLHNFKELLLPSIALAKEDLSPINLILSDFIFTLG